MDGNPARSTAPVLENVEAALEAWRVLGADRVDPLRFERIVALAARARAHEGESRRLLEARLAELVQAYANGLESASSAARAVSPVPAAQTRRSALGELLSRIDHSTAPPASAAEAPRSAARYALSPVLDEFRAIWTRIRTDSQLRESLAQVPVEAGPLNSDMLVHRSITLMGDLSPGYLHHFVAYVDTLSSLQRMFDDQPAPTGSGGAAGKPPRSRARKPRR